jgi:hypothetical protein
MIDVRGERIDVGQMLVQKEPFTQCQMPAGVGIAKADLSNQKRDCGKNEKKSKK